MQNEATTDRRRGRFLATSCSQKRNVQEVGSLLGFKELTCTDASDRADVAAALNPKPIIWGAPRRVIYAKRKLTHFLRCLTWSNVRDPLFFFGYGIPYIELKRTLFSS